MLYFILFTVRAFLHTSVKGRFHALTILRIDALQKRRIGARKRSRRQAENRLDPFRPTQFPRWDVPLPTPHIGRTLRQRMALFAGAQRSVQATQFAHIIQARQRDVDGPRQLARGNGLEQAVPHARLPRRYSPLRSLRGHHQDNRHRATRANLPCRRDPVHIAQLLADQHHVRLQRLDQFNRLPPLRYLADHDITVVFYYVAQSGLESLVILYN